MEFPVIDAHIHLYEESDIPRLNWTQNLAEDHALARANNVGDYIKAIGGKRNVHGFVFIETDRKSGLERDQWNDALEEVGYLARIALGKPRSDKGHEVKDSRLLLGVVPWAPIPGGPANLAEYVDRVLQTFSEGQRPLVKGFRYLLQDKPPNTMLHPDFVGSLLWLGEHDFGFDLGIDARSVGPHQLEEACELFERIYSKGSRLIVIINHFCKPNLRISRSDALSGHPDFTRWKACIEKMASFEYTYMKLSGLFSELPPQTEYDPADVPTLVDYIQQWAEVVFKAFSPSRILFGSDWPVCNVGGPGEEKSWQHWHDVVTALLENLNLTNTEKAMVWSGTAAKAYRTILPSEQGRSASIDHTSDLVSHLSSVMIPGVSDQ